MIPDINAFSLLQSQNTEFDLAQSYFTWAAFRTAHAVRIVWRLMRYGKILFNDKNWFDLAVGGGIATGLQFIPNSWDLKRYYIFGSRVVLLVERIEETFMQVGRTRDAWQLLVAEVKTPTKHYNQLTHDNAIGLAYETLEIPVKKEKVDQPSRFRAICTRIFHFIAETFALINCYLDFIDAFQINDPTLDTESVVLGPHNAFKSIKLVAENGEELLEKWHAHNKIISSILTKLGVPEGYNADFFEEKIRTHLGTIRGLNGRIEEMRENTANTIGGMFKTIGQVAMCAKDIFVIFVT